MAKQKIGICQICGKDALLTDDHIPPACLYPKEIRSIITSRMNIIRACPDCNNGSSEIDEFLK